MDKQDSISGMGRNFLMTVLSSTGGAALLPQ
jgi:hypothetical protein